MFSGIIYGEPRSQQSLHQISLKIFNTVSSEGLKSLVPMGTWSTELNSLSHPTPKASSSHTLINLENILSQQLISQYIALQAV